MAIHDAPLPEPNDRMTPEEKGALLLKYVKARVPVSRRDGTGVWRRCAFKGASAAGASLRNADLMQARLQNGLLSKANLREANLREADLREADLSDGLLEGADFFRGRLDRANLARAALARASLWGAGLVGACLDDAWLRNADLRGARLERATWIRSNRSGTLIDAKTYVRSKWTPEILHDWVSSGAIVDKQGDLPADARLAIRLAGRSSNGLTLTFDKRLHRFGPTAFDALIAEVLGPDTDVTIEERSNMEVHGAAFIRINGACADDLVAVAEAFYHRVWRSAETAADERALQKAMSSGMALLVVRLDEMRDHLVNVQASTDLLADEDVREAITDKAAEHVLAKRKKSFQTGLQRITDGLIKEAPKKLISSFIGKKAADALGDVLGGVAETVVEGAMDVLQDPAEENE